MIRYVSTRGGGSPRSFSDILLSGTAPDGGLYVPESWPALSHDALERMHGRAYADIALEVIRPFVGADIAEKDLAAIVADTYGAATFDHTAVAPLVQLGPGAWLLELYRGPTFSFKDYAMQLLGRLFACVLARQQRRVTIVGATSGDTGSAAIEAFRGQPNIDIFILHPNGRTSEIQRRQMTTVQAPNVHNIALEGTFDDCQALVKDMFADRAMSEELSLTAVNSINWARIMAQIVYYVTTAVALGAPAREVSFTVPTGNFGNVFACWAARQMGLPVRRIVTATNANDIIARFFASGEMRAERVTPSLSPSMDIQVSSNFERYLFDLTGRDAARTAALMAEFAAEKRFSVDDALRARAAGEFAARRSDDAATIKTMKACFAGTGTVIDPHTAVGLSAALDVMREQPETPMVMLGCAHPGKFPDAVRQATGQEPPLPPRLAAVMKKAEIFTVLPNDAARVKRFIRQKSGQAAE
jgi:threonine synthase